MRSVMQDEPSLPRRFRPEIARDLELVCLKAIRYEPSNRYQTADELADDLDRFLRGDTIHAAGSGLLERVTREIGRDQHQGHFQRWHGTLTLLGLIIFVAHLMIFVLVQLKIPREIAYWLPRLVMFGLIFGTIYRARDGSLSPRSIAERPVWSIWLGYLCALAVVNLLHLVDGSGINHRSLFRLHRH